jgi:hypothetical protein
MVATFTFTLYRPRTSFALSTRASQNRRTIDVRAHTAWTIIGRARKEKEISLPLLAQLAQLLQIQHLPQRHPPQCQDILMQMIALRRRPPLKSRRIAPYSRKVAVVQPVNDRFFLLHTRPLLFAAVIMAEADLGVLFGAALVVVLDEAGADEEDVADLDVAASRRGPDVNALRFATGR